MQNRHHKYFIFLFVYVLLQACSTTHPGATEKKTTGPFEKKIKETGPGEAWIKAATATLNDPLDIHLPYAENGYITSNLASATALRFSGKRGQKLKIILTKKNPWVFSTLMDLWQVKENTEPKFLLSADTA